MSSLPASIKRIGSKTIEKRWCHPHYLLMGANCCHGNKIGQLASEIFKFESVDDGR